MIIQPLYGNPAKRFVPTPATTADEIDIGLIKALGIGGVAFDATGNRVANVADPTQPTDAVNKRYVDNAQAGLFLKDDTYLVADTNVSLSGLGQTIDSKTLADGQRVLLIAQTDPIGNGWWVAHSGAWTRPNDFLPGSHAAGAFSYIKAGPVHGNEVWACRNDINSDIVGTHALTFTQINAVPEITTSGTGISLSNGVLSLNYGAGVADSGSGIAVQVDAKAVRIDGSNKVSLYVNPTGPLSADVTNGLSLNVQAGVLSAGSTLALIGLPTTAGLNLLYQGNFADTVHKHRALKDRYMNGPTALAKGIPVRFTSTGVLAASDATTEDTADFVGFTNEAIAPNTEGEVITDGKVEGVLSGATAGTDYFIAASASGGIVDENNIPSATGNAVHRVGYAAPNGLDLVIRPQLLQVR